MPPPIPPESTPGIAYLHQRVARVPWSIHVVRVDRSDPGLEFRSTHARGTVLGLSTLTEQIQSLDPAGGTPLAAVNGDFYQRGDRAYAGDPRGLQLVDGELISAPSGGVSFWIDAARQPHATNVESRFQVTWPGGLMTPFGLNEEFGTNDVVLYTPSLGASTQTGSGTELILEPTGTGPWLPLRPGMTCEARIREIRETGNTPLDSNVMVLAISPWMESRPQVGVGAMLRLSTATFPDLTGVRMAISGGPVLVRSGKRLMNYKPEKNGFFSFRRRHVWERHPRTAVGWNDKYVYMVAVDGRQKKLSVGMDLNRLSDYLADLGCQTAMNLDGGGSATLWCQGAVRNDPSDAFSVVDIVDLPSLTLKLKQQSDGVSEYLVNRFSYGAWRQLFGDGDPDLAVPPWPVALVEQLDSILRGPTIYEAQRFAGVALSAETRQLLEQEPEGEARVRLNRQLLADAYPQEIARSLAKRERHIANALVVVRKGNDAN